MPSRLYMVVEHCKNRTLWPCIAGFVTGAVWHPKACHLSSWVDERFDRCYQRMETEDGVLLDEWMTNWDDLVEFEVYPVMPSKQAAEKVAPRL